MAASNAVILARRALVVAAAALVLAVIALVAALRGGSGTDEAEDAGAESAQDEAAAALAGAEEAAASAEASAARAQEALAQADALMAPGVVAEIEALLAEARAAAAEDAPMEEPAAEEEPAVEPMEEPAAEDAPAEDAPPVEEPAAEDASEPTQATDDASLPGEPYGFGPPEAARLAVVGVSYDSLLNVRDVPNGEIVAKLGNVLDGVRDPAVLLVDPVSYETVATLDPVVVATGNSRELSTTTWSEFRAGEVVGWANSAYLAPLGADREVTDDIVDALGGIPTADTREALGRRVAGVFEASGEVRSRTIISGRPGVSEAVGRITLDVIGLPDDAVRGYRISVVADAAAEAGPFTLSFAAVTPICYNHRGAGQDGLCN